MTTETKGSLIPEEKLPAACRRMGCTVGFRRPGVVYPGGDIFFVTGDDSGLAAFLIHGDGPNASAYAIPKAWLDEPDPDLHWMLEVKPWLRSLHDQGERPVGEL